MNSDFEIYLQEQGWIVECESPLEIRHTDGSFASQQAAMVLLDSLQVSFKEETASPTGYKEIIPQLNELNDLVQSYVEKTALALDNDDSYENRQLRMQWQVIYDLVFSKAISRKVNSLFEDLNIRFDYYDPDTSYQDDVKAFADALKSKMDLLNKLHS